MQIYNNNFLQKTLPAPIEEILFLNITNKCHFSAGIKQQKKDTAIAQNISEKLNPSERN